MTDSGDVTKEVGEKRKGDQNEASNPKKKRKIKRARFDPCVIRRRIQDFFKTKQTDDTVHIEEFFKSCEVSNFKEFGFNQRTFYEFIKEHNISWKDGAVTGPTEEWLQAKMRTQMEFYFSDANLARDEFLLKEIGRSDDRWVKLKVFRKFKLINKWSDKPEDLTSALATSQKLELDAPKKCVRRKEKLTITKWDIDKRTTKVNGFRFAKGKANLEKMREFFQQWGIVDAVFPRKPKNSFVGSLEVIWSDEKTAAEFRKQKSVKYLDDKLDIKQEVVANNFELCFKFDTCEVTYKELRMWLGSLNVPAKQVEKMGGSIYIWGKMPAADVIQAVEKAEDPKKYGTCTAVEPVEYDKVFGLFNRFKGLTKGDKFRKQKKYKKSKMQNEN